MKPNYDQSEVLRRVVRFTRVGDIVLVIVPVFLGLTFGGIAAATGQWLPASIILALGVCVAGAFLWRTWRNLRGLSLAFDSDPSPVVWVYGNWRTRNPSASVPTETSSLEGAWIIIGLSDGRFCKLRLPRGTPPAQVVEAMQGAFPNAVHGYRDDFPKAFKSDPEEFRRSINQAP